MRQTSKFVRRIRLVCRHFGLIARAVVALLFFRMLLWAFRYRQIAKLIRVQIESPPSPANPYLFSWAVRHASRIVPGASCLTQALALQYLLARKGTSVVIRVGVAYGAGQQRDAHAWVVLDDIILLGGTSESLKGYAVLTDLTPSFK